MTYSEGNINRIFVLKLEKGDRLPDTIEEFAKDKNIQSACVLFLGGADETSKIVVGPEKDSEKPIKITQNLFGISEANGVGTIFKNEDGIPKLHMHASFGREQTTITGCVREGVDIWLIGEIIILEIIGVSSIRKKDKCGFELLSN